MADTRKAEFTLKEPTRIRLEFNGKEVYNEELPAGPHVLKLEGIVPQETGTTVLFMDDEAACEWDCTYNK